MSRRDAVHELETLVSSYHSFIAIETVEEERARSLLIAAATDLQIPFFEWSLGSQLRRLQGTMVEGTEEATGVLQHIMHIDGEGIYLLKDLAPHLSSAAASRALRELIQKLTSTRSAVVITGDPIELPRDLDALAVRFSLDLPDLEELRDLVRSVIESMSTRQRVRVDLGREDAQRLIRTLSGLTLAQARQVIAQAIVEDGALTARDLDSVIRSKGQIIDRGGILEFFPPEGNHFELGGFHRLKEWLDRARVGFSPQAQALNLEAPRGILLVGVQGCGKSLAAKFIARHWGLPLLRLDAGRFYDKDVGETEKRFRRATAMAEAMAPVVLWIDEIEKSFARGGDGDADGGLSRRLFGSFLSWLQEKRSEVFVVGAANDLMVVPPELLRKGRFDEIFFVDLPGEHDRGDIAAIHLRLRKQDPSRFDLKAIIAASEGFSGAEIEQAIVAAIYRALQRNSPLTTEMVIESIKATVPLSVARREDVQRIRDEAAGRFTPVA
jgi:hypothetical protein